MIPAALSFVDGLALDVAAQNRTANEALCLLRARGLTPDLDALTQAVDAIDDRAGLTGGTIDPLHYLEASPRPGLDALRLAVELAEDQLESALRVLAAPAELDVAS